VSSQVNLAPEWLKDTSSLRIEIRGDFVSKSNAQIQVALTATATYSHMKYYVMLSIPDNKQFQ